MYEYNINYFPFRSLQHSTKFLTKTVSGVCLPCEAVDIEKIFIFTICRHCNPKMHCGNIIKYLCNGEKIPLGVIFGSAYT